MRGSNGDRMTLERGGGVPRRWSPATLCKLLALSAAGSVDASSSGARAAAAASASAKGIASNASSETREARSRRHLRPLATLPDLRRARGGGSGEEDGPADGGGPGPSLADPAASGGGIGGDEKGKSGGWGGLFGKKKATGTAGNDASPDGGGDENSGSFEITMNATPDGKGEVRVDIDAPQKAKDMARETLGEALDEMEGAANGKKGGSAAHRVSAGGAMSNSTVKAGGRVSTKLSPAPSSGDAHISSKFPIARSELPHFFSMSFMMFLFIYVFTTVRDTKDTLVVSNCGAEAIPFLKLYAVMPCATAFIVVYSKLSNALGKQALFYVTLIPFFVFYGLFAFVLFPNREALHFPPPPLAEGAVASGGVGNAAMNLLRYWSFSLYFVVSELWASAGVPLLFWQCANDVTPMAQAKRFYPLFAITGNLAPIVSGKVMSFVISLQKTNDDVGFGSTLKTLAVIKAIVCLGIIAIYRNVYAMAEERDRKERTEQSLKTIRGIQRTGKVEITMKFEKPKQKLTLKQSARELMASRELKAMATMVFCYNVCVELTEVIWKAILRRTYPTKSSYMDYMARFSQTVGVVAFFLQLVASEIINVFGWKWTAMIPPVTMGVLAVAFFAAIIAGEEQIPLAQALLIGTVQNVANKVTKYSLFDPCKEMAYIPLGPEAKVKGKAAVDVLGARLGRSMGSATQQLLVFLVGGPTGSILNCVPYICAWYVTAIAMWSNAVSVLGRLFDNSDESPRPDNTQKLEKIGEAITIIKSIEDAKREKKKKGSDGKAKDGRKK